jgi:hypothetical protein
MNNGRKGGVRRVEMEWRGVRMEIRGDGMMVLICLEEVVSVRGISRFLLKRWLSGKWKSWRLGECFGEDCICMARFSNCLVVQEMALEFGSNLNTRSVKDIAVECRQIIDWREVGIWREVIGEMARFQVGVWPDFGRLAIEIEILSTLRCEVDIPSAPLPDSKIISEFPQIFAEFQEYYFPSLFDRKSFGGSRLKPSHVKPACRYCPNAWEVIIAEK